MHVQYQPWQNPQYFGHSIDAVDVLHTTVDDSHQLSSNREQMGIGIGGGACGIPASGC